MKLTDLPVKRILLIVGFVLVIIIVSIFLYLAFFRATPTTIEPGTATTTPGGVGGLPGTPGGTPDRPIVDELGPGELPDAVARGGITEINTITTNQILDISRGSGNTLSYYDSFTGQFYKLDANGNIRTLSDAKFPNVESVAWSGTGEKAILEFPDGANVFFDFSTDEQVTLPSHWTDFEYSPSSDEIVFKSIALEPENNFLAIADERGSGAIVVESLGQNSNRVLPLWSPNNQIVATYAEPRDGSRQTVYFIGKNDENYKSLVVNGYNYESIWNKNGTQLLYNVTSASSNNNPRLWIVNAQGDAIGSGRRPLNIQTTVDKCVFQDERTLYCAVPQFLPAGSGIFPSVADGIPDDIYKIDVVTGSSSLLAIMDSPSPATSLTLSADNRYLYFIDEQTGVLKQLRLR